MESSTALLCAVSCWSGMEWNGGAARHFIDTPRHHSLTARPVTSDVVTYYRKWVSRYLRSHAER